MPTSPLGIALCVLAAALAGGVLYVAAVARYYRVRSPRPVRTLIRTSDGGTLAVYRRTPAVRRFEEPVLLCHGIATSHLNFDFDPPYSLAHVMADAGFECFSLDFRGTGPSRPPPGQARFDFSVDDLIAFDGPALVAHALAVTGARRAFWVGHSLGGLVGYGVATGPVGEELAGLCALGAPVFFSFRPWIQRVVRLSTWLAWPRALRQRGLTLALAPFLGYVTPSVADILVNPKNIRPSLQRKVFAVLLQPIGRRLLLQFSDWITHDAFRSVDRSLDYRARLAGLAVPALVMGGSQDQLASAVAVQKQFALLGSTDKTLMLFGPENGDALAYGHGDLLLGAAAPTEVYPRIRDWLAAHATAAQAGAAEAARAQGDG